MKKILILGATPNQIPVINYAKSQGYYVITCDYLPKNPGHALAHEWHNVSTTDKEGVLKLAKTLKIDGILAFASDPAAPTAAYVAEHLNLPGNPYNTAQRMVEKDLFRSFLLENGFNVPKFKSYTSLDVLLQDVNDLTFPLVIKPVDSSGSKGIAKINEAQEIPQLFETAMSFSRCKRVIVEEYISGPQFHGDGFVENGELVFCYLGDHSLDGFKIIATTFPSKYPASLIQKIENEVQRILQAIGFISGGINIEVRVSETDGKIYVIEIGPRNGGGFMPEIIQYASGYDFIKSAVDAAIGKKYQVQSPVKQGHFLILVLYSPKAGLFDSVRISDAIKANLLEMHLYKKPGDKLSEPKDSSTWVGTILLKFSSAEEVDRVVKDPFSYYEVKYQ